MVLIAVLYVAASASTALASGHLRSNVNMQPEQVAATLVSVQNEWKAQAHVFSQCKRELKDELPVCKEAPEAFHHSCIKVLSTLVMASSGNVDDSAEYMKDVCSQKLLSPWHQSKCNVVGAAITNKMSGNPAENRENYFSHAEEACSGVWSVFLDEQGKLHDVEVEAEKEQAAKDAEEDAKLARLKAEQEKKAELKAEQEKKAQLKAEQEKEAQLKAQEVEIVVAQPAPKDVAEKKHQETPKPVKDEIEIVVAPSASKAAVHKAAETVGKATKSIALLQVSAPADELAKEMTHDLELNFNRIAPFGKEDTAKELQDHASKTQDTLVDAVENAEVAEIKRAVFRALTRLRAATIKEFDTIARLETQAIDAYNDAHHFRAENPLAHLHEDEAPVESDKLKSFH